MNEAILAKSIRIPLLRSYHLFIFICLFIQLIDKQNIYLFYSNRNKKGFEKQILKTLKRFYLWLSFSFLFILLRVYVLVCLCIQTTLF